MSDQRLLSILELEKERNIQVPIIVEGIHDINALRKIGFTGNIIKINDGTSIHEFCMRISSKYEEIIMLTDFDKKGRQLRERIESLLLLNNVHVSTTLWRTLRKYNIKSVEDLPSLISSIENEMRENRN
ncbi:toprim domain-containing protein [Cuniculiplasma sp. SKW3]|uniref:toprim domain-containing protein n=1 Tax=unclassified Cuniculiplasma TaxID=2619706 RepID=UPI003FCEFE16